jgi:inorganic triphosphatase YgiF
MIETPSPVGPDFFMAKKSNKPASKQTRSIETELRLAGDPETLRRVFDSPPLAPREDREDKLTDLENRYFDTADQKLRAEGLALRVRTDGHGDHHQTLKAGDCAQAALLKRGEWNMPVSAYRPSLSLLPKEARAILPKEALQDTLQEAFETRVQRHTREITIDEPDHPLSRIEASLDLGEIETDVGTLPIAELELELLEGQPETLYQVALDLQEFGPLHLETRSKSSRAYDQLRKQPPSYHRAVAPRLTSSDTVDEAMAAIFASCYSQWLANQAAAIDGRDPEGVHQMRIGLRRLRSAFSVFRPLIPNGQLIW